MRSFLPCGCVVSQATGSGSDLRTAAVGGKCADFMRSRVLFLLPLAAHAVPLPPPAQRPVDFTKDIQPLFEASCVKCHAKGKDKGGLSIEKRELFLKGGDTGPAAIPGDGGKSLVVEMVGGMHPDNVMPKKGTRWTPEQVGLLRAWIDQ